MCDCQKNEAQGILREVQQPKAVGFYFCAIPSDREGTVHLTFRCPDHGPKSSGEETVFVVFVVARSTAMNDSKEH